MNLEDSITKLLRSITLSFGVNHPIKFTLSICGGMTAFAVIKIISALFPNIATLAAFAKIEIYYYISAALLINFGILRYRKTSLPEKISDNLKIIEIIIVRACESEDAKRQIWRRVLEKYIASIELYEAENRDKIKNLSIDAVKEIVD
jgi:hypothetical protein